MLNNTYIMNSIPIKEENNIVEDGKIDKKIDHPAENYRQQFEELITCHVCFCNASNPMMCPFCSKLYC